MLASTTVGYLFQLSVGHRIASAEIAGRIEKASEQIAKNSNLPVIKREKICPACASCPLAKAARESDKKGK
jgi:formate dehydrogenase maturation protein FdhE